MKQPPVYTDDNRYRFVDEVLSLYPPGGLSYTTYEVNPNFVGGGLGFVKDQLPTPFDAPANQSIISVIPHPESHSGLALVSDETGNCVLYQTPHGNRSIQLLTLPLKTRCLALGFGHTVYAATDREIVELEVMNGVARRLDQVSLPGDNNNPAEVSALTYVCDAVRGLCEFKTHRHSGSWRPARDPLFGHLDCVGKRFVVLKSHTNVRAGQYSAAEWYNIDPEELGDQGPDVPDN